MTQRPFRFVTQVRVTSSAPPETVFATVVDLRAHLEWSGERAEDDSFKLLAIEQTSPGEVTVGTTFESSGANFNGTFHDRSVVAELSPPNVVVIETDARLDRDRGTPWEVHFTHRYDIAAHDAGSSITYTETISRLNYVPYWLKAPLRPITRRAINRGDTDQLRNLADLAEERAAGDGRSLGNVGTD
jgi:hypothetical protein